MYVPKQQALANNTRRRILDHIRRNPGSHLQELAQLVGSRTSSVLWHVRKLEAAGLVRSGRHGRFRVYHAIDGGLDGRRLSRAVAILKNGTARAVGNTLANHPEMATADIARLLGIDASTVRAHLRRMVAGDLVRRFGGPMPRYALRRLARDALEAAP